MLLIENLNGHLKNWRLFVLKFCYCWFHILLFCCCCKFSRQHQIGRLSFPYSMFVQDRYQWAIAFYRYIVLSAYYMCNSHILCLHNLVFSTLKVNIHYRFFSSVSSTSWFCWYGPRIKGRSTEPCSVALDKGRPEL